jgi:hypothetical protein
MPLRRHPFFILVRHFFGRFFDTESFSPQSEPAARMTQTLGILAVPGAFFILMFLPCTFAGWALVSGRYLFLSVSMLLMGFIMVFEWDALFPDRRDYLILSTLPIRISTLFLAKVTALAIFLAVFLLDVNFFSALLWPAMDGGPDGLGILWAHTAAMVLGGLFMALAIGALRGVLVTLLPARVLRPVSVLVQAILMAALVMLFFLTYPIAFHIRGLLKYEYFPPLWFIGLYETLRPAIRRGSPELLHLGAVGVKALWGAAGLFLLTYLPLYRRHARRIIEAPDSILGPRVAARSRVGALLDRVLLKHPVEQAVFHFIGQTLARSAMHRLFLATYGGFGAAIAVLTLGSGADGRLRLPLSLSFVLISGLRAAFNFPSELPANWAFRISETAGVRGYLAATRKWIVACAVVPLFALLAPVEFVTFAPVTAAFHTVYGIALSLLLMEILFFGFRKVPFTCSHFPGKVNLVGLGAAYILGFTLYSRSMATLERWLAEWPSAAVAFLAVVGAACILLKRLGERESGSATLDYEERVDPTVRTLDLSLQ